MRGCSEGGDPIVVVARRPDVSFAGQVATAAPAGFWCEPVAPDAVVVHPPEWDPAAQGPARLAEFAADIAALIDVRWAGVGTR